MATLIDSLPAATRSKMEATQQLTPASSWKAKSLIEKFKNKNEMERNSAK
jgi:hypothetical protein